MDLVCSVAQQGQPKISHSLHPSTAGSGDRGVSDRARNTGLLSGYKGIGYYKDIDFIPNVKLHEPIIVTGMYSTTTTDVGR